MAPKDVHKENNSLYWVLLSFIKIVNVFLVALLNQEHHLGNMVCFVSLNTALGSFPTNILKSKI